MLMTFTLGAQADIASGDEVKTHSDRIIDSVEGMFTRVSKKPVYVRRAASVTLAESATGVTDLALGTPPLNTVWEVHRVALIIRDGLALDVAIPSDAFAGVYVGVPDSPVGFQGYIDRSLGRFEPSTPLPLQGNDELWVRLYIKTGIQSAVKVTAVSLIGEYRDQAVVRSLS